MTTTTYSIAEARNQFTALIRQVNQVRQPIHVTRHGEAVAVIMSADEYEQLTAQNRPQDFWEAYQLWREEWGAEGLDEEFDPFADVRDRSPGREVNVWD